MRVIYSEPQTTYTLDFSEKGISIHDSSRRSTSFLPVTSISMMTSNKDSSGHQTTLIQTVQASSQISIGLPAQAYSDSMNYFFRKKEESLLLSDRKLTFCGTGLEIQYTHIDSGTICIYIAQKNMIYLRHTIYEQKDVPMQNTIHLYYDTQNIRMKFDTMEDSCSAYNFMKERM